MALPPVTSRPAQPSALPSGADAARRAFFQTALAKAAPVATSPNHALAPAVTPLKDEHTVAPQPGRILRPGSLVDIKV